MTRDGLHRTGGRIGPKRMGAPFTLQDASVESKMPKQATPLHASGNVSHFDRYCLPLGIGGYAAKAILPPIL